MDVWPDQQRVRSVYGQSVEYTLGAMFSFLHTYDQPNLVLVVLGDHQPARIVSGPEADRDVPITIISKDPAVFERDRLVAVGCRRPPVAGGADLADGSVPRSVLGGVRRLTPRPSDVAGLGSVVCTSRVVSTSPRRWTSRRTEHEDRGHGEHHDADRFDDHRLRDEREVPGLGDPEQPDREGEDEREPRVAIRNSRLSTVASLRSAAPQDDHRDREDDAGDDS